MNEKIIDLLLGHFMVGNTLCFWKGPIENKSFVNFYWNGGKVVIDNKFTDFHPVQDLYWMIFFKFFA